MEIEIEETVKLTLSSKEAHTLTYRLQYPNKKISGGEQNFINRLINIIDGY